MGNCLKLGKAQRETKVGKLHVYLSTAINGSSKQRILKKKKKKRKENSGYSLTQLTRSVPKERNAP